MRTAPGRSDPPAHHNTLRSKPAHNPAQTQTEAAQMKHRGKFSH